MLNLQKIPETSLDGYFQNVKSSLIDYRVLYNND